MHVLMITFTSITMARSASVQDIFMLFGDSLTQRGWQPGLDAFGQQLSHVYARRLEVLNRGYSGYNTNWAIPILKNCITCHESSPKVRVLTIWFGANDACIPPSPQHVPLSMFKANLKHMILLVKKSTSSAGYPSSETQTRILLISPPPVDIVTRRADLASRDPPQELDRDFDVTRRYADAVADVAREEGVAFVDVWNRIWDEAGREESNLTKFLADGLHLSAEGYAIMYEELIDVIVREYPDVHYDSLPFVFPLWQEINRDDPSQSLSIQK